MMNFRQASFLEQWDGNQLCSLFRYDWCGHCKFLSSSISMIFSPSCKRPEGLLPGSFLSPDCRWKARVDLQFLQWDRWLWSVDQYYHFLLEFIKTTMMTVMMMTMMVTCEHADNLLPAVAQVCQQVAWRGKEHIVNITWHDENDDCDDDIMMMRIMKTFSVTPPVPCPFQCQVNVSTLYHIMSAHSDGANNPYHSSAT